MIRIIFFLLISYGLTGCAESINAFYNRDVIEDTLINEDNAEMALGTLSVTAQRRIIVANMISGNFCAEPPPEAADTITTAIATALQANIDADKTVNAELAANFSKHVNQLYRRTHTVQLFRDAAFYYCVDAVNSSNGAKGSYQAYSTHLNTTVNALVKSLDKEVALYYKTEIEKAKQPNYSTEFVVCNSESLVDKDGDKPKQLMAKIHCQPLLSQPEKVDSKKDKKPAS